MFLTMLEHDETEQFVYDYYSSIRSPWCSDWYRVTNSFANIPIRRFNKYISISLSLCQNIAHCLRLWHDNDNNRPSDSAVVSIKRNGVEIEKFLFPITSHLWSRRNRTISNDVGELVANQFRMQRNSKGNRHKSGRKWKSFLARSIEFRELFISWDIKWLTRDYWLELCSMLMNILTSAWFLALQQMFESVNTDHLTLHVLFIIRNTFISLRVIRK